MLMVNAVEETLAIERRTKGLEIKNDAAGKQKNSRQKGAQHCHKVKGASFVTRDARRWGKKNSTLRKRGLNGARGSLLLLPMLSGGDEVIFINAYWAILLMIHLLATFN